MNDIEKEYERMSRLYEEQYRLKSEEYRKLTSIASVVVIVTTAIQLVALSSLSAVVRDHWLSFITVASIAAPVVYVISKFFIRARHSVLGTRAYLNIEKSLLINEMPNIFQIVSLLGFLNVFLKEYWIRIVVTAFITFLLSIYLTSRRRDMVAKLPKHTRTNVSSDITSLLSISLAIIFGLAVYGLASLVSAQLS